MGSKDRSGPPSAKKHQFCFLARLSYGAGPGLSQLLHPLTCEIQHQLGWMRMHRRGRGLGSHGGSDTHLQPPAPGTFTRSLLSTSPHLKLLLSIFSKAESSLKHRNYLHWSCQERLQLKRKAACRCCDNRAQLPSGASETALHMDWGSNCPSGSHPGAIFLQ